MSRVMKSVALGLVFALCFAVVAPAVALAADENAPAPAGAPATAGEPAPAEPAAQPATEPRGDDNDYNAGVEAGRKAAIAHYAAAEKTGWFAAGMGFGVIGVAIAYLKKPTATADKYIKCINQYLPKDREVSEQYKKGFVDGFCKYANKERGKDALIGWGTWVVIALSGGLAGGGGN